MKEPEMPGTETPKERMGPSKAKAYDRRLDVRVPVQLQVDIEIPNQHYLFEFSSNLSQNGIFIHTDDPLDPGTEVTIQFVLPDAHKIRTRGEVIWVNREDDVEPGMGVRFMGLTESDRDQILTALKKLAIL